MVKHSKKSSAGSGLGNLGVSTGAKNRTDPAWNHCVEVVHDGEEKRAYKYVRCNYCEKVVKGGVSSGREGEDEGNVASGGSVSKRGICGPMDRYMVKGNSSGEQTTTIAPPQNAKELRQQVGAYGRGLKPPTMYEIRTWILKEELKITERFVDDIKSTWPLRQPLESMFTSEKWTNSNYASKADGKEVRKIILKDNNFWLGLIYTIKTTKPLVKVLRLVDGEKEHAMGFLYNAMDEAKEKIAKNLGGEEKDYKEIWDIIDEKWDFQMHRHLHAAAYYLNPRCHYSPDFSTHTEIKLGLFHCLDKLIPNRDDMEKADLQCSAFHSREGFFGLAQAKNTVHKRTPVEWWTQYGDGTPELQKHLKLKSLVNDEDSLLIDELPSDDEWLVGENDEDAPHLTVDDLDVDVLEGEPSQATQTQPNESSSKKVSAKGGSSKGKGKLHLVDEDEDDWEDFDNEDDEALELDDASDEVSL
nr:uncharacterized protein LOC109157329 [Ipomoea batatas]